MNGLVAVAAVMAIAWRITAAVEHLKGSFSLPATFVEYWSFCASLEVFSWLFNSVLHQEWVCVYSRTYIPLFIEFIMAWKLSQGAFDLDGR